MSRLAFWGVQAGGLTEKDKNLMFFDKKLLTDIKNGCIVSLTINIKKLFFIVLLSCKSKGTANNLTNNLLKMKNALYGGKEI